MWDKKSNYIFSAEFQDGKDSLKFPETNLPLSKNFSPIDIVKFYY